MRNGVSQYSGTMEQSRNSVRELHGNDRLNDKMIEKQDAWNDIDKKQ